MHTRVIQQVSMVDEDPFLGVVTIKAISEYNECMNKLRGG